MFYESIYAVYKTIMESYINFSKHFLKHLGCKVENAVIIDLQDSIKSYGNL